MTDTSLNPTGAGFFNDFSNGAVRQQFVVDPGAGTLPIGTVVQIEDYSGPGTDQRTTVPLIEASATNTSTQVIGVISPGTDFNDTPAVAAGKVATVTCTGVCQVLVDATTTAGEALVQSTSTAGAARTDPAPDTTTLGVCLESVVVSAGTQLAWAYISPGGGSGSGSGIGQVLMLTYYDGEGESDPFPVQVFGVPAGYTPGEGIASLGAQLIVGDAVGIPSGVLLDANSDPIPDGWTFTAAIFVEGSVIYDIVAINTWTGAANGGVLVWGSSGGAPGPLSVPGGIDIPTGDLVVGTGGLGVGGAAFFDGTVTMDSLPTSDPAAVGQLWNNLGIVTVSAG